MEYFLRINIDNAAFAENPGEEVARILRDAATRVNGYQFQHSEHIAPLRDANGNYVG